jgi:hypothetical protein
VRRSNEEAARGRKKARALKIQMEEELEDAAELRRMLEENERAKERAERDGEDRAAMIELLEREQEMKEELG